ncbi:glycosyltransferase [Arcobacter sp. FWKO B]|uniref:glycosyltransferase n=1 Tax=Arcobacter sp. FWKO B TaxID=2593672 RepID=UPI0018A4BBF8|nr:glycosyltransferase [Arcobacter sp. FWKO B]QOG11499.1 glycosyltransferase [Arcobacter sp. FWKO B]
MNLPKSSFIISVYKDTDSLDLILDSLSNQTVLPNEVLISEDGDSNEMFDYVKMAKEKYKNLNITHLFQEDIGWRKNRALNRAVVASKYEYLIFIDGDCVPYSTFIEGHVKLAEKGIVLCGKRFELGEEFSLKVKSRKIRVFDIEKNFFRLIRQLLKDKARHPEDGIPLLPNSIISKLIHMRKVRHIIGCNFSCYKDDFYKINGFDETFVLPCEGEDVDPTWRFRSAGIEMKSCRNVANIAHLYHKKRFGEDEGAVNRSIMNSNKEKNIFYCKNGINKVCE